MWLWLELQLRRSPSFLGGRIKLTIIGVHPQGASGSSATHGRPPIGPAFWRRARNVLDIATYRKMRLRRLKRAGSAIWVVVTCSGVDAAAPLPEAAVPCSENVIYCPEAAESVRPGALVFLEIEFREPYDHALATLQTSLGEGPWEVKSVSDDGLTVLMTVSGEGTGAVCMSSVVRFAFFTQKIRVRADGPRIKWSAFGEGEATEPSSPTNAG